ncbi:hypothetical protein NMG60_11031187 [Bertholletia excelsa]
MDADMMDTDKASPPSNAVEGGGGGNGNDVVSRLLTLARQLVDQAKPSQALQLVVMAMKATGGDGAVFQTLNRARELYRNKLQTSTAADELASLFAECAIAEAVPSKPDQSENRMVSLPVEPDAHGTSILAETGRKQIVLDAFSDGSSFVCLRCGGLVGNSRKDEHYAYWCCKI